MGGNCLCHKDANSNFMVVKLINHEQHQGGLHCDQKLCKRKKLDKNQTENKRTKDRTSEKELGGFRVQLT
jgi:hypothetical protein